MERSLAGQIRYRKDIKYMCKKQKTIVTPGEDIAKILREENNMEIYGLFSVLSHRVHCLEAYKENVIELLTKDSIAFELMIGLVKFTTGEHHLEFKAIKNRETFLKTAYHNGTFAAAPGSNYMVTYNRVPNENKVQVLFLDLRILRTL